MQTELIYGRRPVAETLRAGRRSFKRLVLAEGGAQSGGLEPVVEQATQQGVRVDVAPRDWLDSRTRRAKHQGIVLETGPYPYVALEESLTLSRRRNEPPLLLLLDLLQDVQNVGTLLRTAEAVGVHGVVLQERRAAEITPAVVSASSGAVEHLLVAQVTNLVRTMKALKKEEVWLVGLDLGEGSSRYDQADLRGGLGLVVGSEGKGLRRLVRETCDFSIHLPMRGQIESLNAAMAGSIALYAIWQARNFCGAGP